MSKSKINESNSPVPSESSKTPVRSSKHCLTTQRKKTFSLRGKKQDDQLSQRDREVTTRFHREEFMRLFWNTDEKSASPYDWMAYSMIKIMELESKIDLLNGLITDLIEIVGDTK